MYVLDINKTLLPNWQMRLKKVTVIQQAVPSCTSSIWVYKESVCNARDPGLIPESGRSPGEGNGNPLQYSCLGNPMDRGDWQATYSSLGQHDWATDTHFTIYYNYFSK